MGRTRPSCTVFRFVPNSISGFSAIAFALRERAFQCWQCLAGFYPVTELLWARLAEGFMESWHVPRGQRAKSSTWWDVQHSQTAPIQGCKPRIGLGW